MSENNRKPDRPFRATNLSLNLLSWLARSKIRRVKNRWALTDTVTILPSPDEGGIKLTKTGWLGCLPSSPLRSPIRGSHTSAVDRIINEKAGASDRAEKCRLHCPVQEHMGASTVQAGLLAIREPSITAHVVPDGGGQIRVPCCGLLTAPLGPQPACGSWNTG